MLKVGLDTWFKGSEFRVQSSVFRVGWGWGGGGAGGEGGLPL